MLEQATDEKSTKEIVGEATYERDLEMYKQVGYNRMLECVSRRGYPEGSAKGIVDHYYEVTTNSKVKNTYVPA